MKKVIILSHGLSANGIDSFVANVVKALDKEKFNISVVMALDEGVAQLREQGVLEAGVSVYRTCDLGSMGRLFTHCKKLYSILKREKPDVFHANMDLLNGFNMVIAWLAGVPIRVCHSHTSSSQAEEQKGKRSLVKIYRVIMRVLCKWFSNRKCGCSGTAMTYLYGSGWEKKRNTYIVNNGIDVKRFFRDHSGEKANNDGTMEKTIVTVGRLSAVKNPGFAISVIEELTRLRRDFRYIWVGAGELREEMQEIVEEKGLQQIVELLGVRSDVDAILKQCDLFLMPSLFEGLPLALIEAQAAGLPCVISDTITREIDCGGCQFVSLKKPASYWASVISDLIDGNIKFSIRREDIETFDTGYTVKQLEMIYEG